MDPFIHYGMGAAIQAIKDANLEITRMRIVSASV